MPAKKRAPALPQFAKLLQCFPCPAWIKNSAGEILARNARSGGLQPPDEAKPRTIEKQRARSARPADTIRRSIAGKDARAPFQTVTYPLPSVDNVNNLRLVARIPAAQETRCQHRIISALLAKILQPQSQSQPQSQPRQPTAAPDVPSEASILAILTPRERDIFRELARGRRYKDIAEDLGISHETVRWHTSRMRQKLGPRHIPILRQDNPKPPQPKPT